MDYRIPPSRAGPHFDVRPVPDHGAFQHGDWQRKLRMPATPLVNDLMPANSEALRDLHSTDELVNVDEPPHTSDGRSVKVST